MKYAEHPGFTRKITAVLLGATAASLAIAGSAHAATTLSGNLTADNAFFAYVSGSDSTLGTLVASGNNWPSSFSLPATVLGPGANYLNIEAINYGGPGGFIGSFTVGGNTILTNTTQWTAIYNNNNSSVTPQPWVTPTALAEWENQPGYGYPWGVPSPINPSAEWIWASGTATNGCQPLNGGYCTVDLSVQLTSVPEASTWAMMALGFAGLAFAGYRTSPKTVSIAA